MSPAVPAVAAALAAAPVAPGRTAVVANADGLAAKKPVDWAELVCLRTGRTGAVAPHHAYADR